MSYRQRGEEIERLRRLLRAANKRVRQERAKWDEKCPKGHLCRHDLCTVECYIVVIDPIDTPFLSMLPKTTSDGLMHEWTTDKLTPYGQGEIELGKPLTPEAKEKLLDEIVNGPPSAAAVAWGNFMKKLYEQFDIDLTEKQTGWWIRIPYGWWLKLKGWFRGKA